MGQPESNYEFVVQNVQNNRIQAPAQANFQASEEAMGMGMGGMFGILFCIFTFANLGFIVASLIYAYQGSTCVLTMVDGFAFNLKTWLQVDSYMRIAMVSLLLIVAIVSCINFKAGFGLAFCVLCTMIIYSIFALAWTIVGSVLFWGKLNSQGYCKGGVKNYMYALLIISYISICCNCLYSRNQQKSQGGSQ